MRRYAIENAMSDDVIRALQAELAAYQRRLTVLQTQIAQFGSASAPADKILERDEARAEIARLAAELRARDVSIEPHINPDKFIDREFEQELFEELLALRDDARVLAIRAGGGMGKSSLLAKFQYRCRNVRPRIAVALAALDQLPDASPLALIREIVRQLTAMHVDFTAFQKNETARMAGDFPSIRAFLDFERASFSGARDIHIRGVNVERAERMSISTAIVQLTDEQDSVAQEASVSAFFADLARHCAAAPAVIMLDAYDRCAPSLQRWLIEHFLEALCFDRDKRPPRLVVVLAGRDLPVFEQRWTEQDLNRTLRLIPQMSTWERRHIEECLRVHGFDYTPEIIDRFYWFVQQGLPPSQLVQMIESMQMAQRGRQ